MISIEVLKNRCSIDNNGCWLWQKAKDRTGYGVVWNGTKLVRAHRLSFELSNHDKNIEKLNICHHCDVKKCINPSHLYAGTQKENMRDALLRGRINHRRGETSPKSKLTKDEVITIRKLSSDGIGMRELGRRYNLNHGSIVRLVQRKTWSHIT